MGRAEWETDLILLGELEFLVSVDGDQVEGTPAPSLDIRVTSKLLQYGRDHFAWSAPAERQEQSDLAIRESTQPHELGIEIDQDDFIACMLVQCDLVKGLGEMMGTLLPSPEQVDHTL